MCGIGALFHHGGAGRTELRRELTAISSQMSKRGPDGSGIWVEEGGRAGLAHRRLAILDLSEAGAQPMVSSCGSLAISFNGEIYNFLELRSLLVKRGYGFRSATDTEVLLNAYVEFGERMVERLRGMFAFALWDGRRHGLFLARDHFGIKPLYFHDDGETIRVASQVKALLAGGVPARPEPAGHVGFFLLGSVPEPFTLYRDVFALPAGSSLWIDEAGARSPRRYFSVAEALEEAAQTREARTDRGIDLTDATRRTVVSHLLSDVPVCAHLSAGLDSATIASVAAEHSRDLGAVTLGFAEFEGTPQDEVPSAARLAERFGFRHRVGRIAARDFEEDLQGILAAMDQPSVDGVNTWFVSRETARAGYKVALSGLGGDEFLGGYPSFSDIPRMLRMARPLGAVPGLGRVTRIVSSRIIARLTSPKYAGLLEYGGTYGGAYLLRKGLFMPWELPGILEPDLVREGWASLAPVLRMNETANRLKSARAVVSTLEATWYMRNQLLRDADWAGMAHSLEIRTPFVDIEFFRALAPWIVSPKPPEKREIAATPATPLPSEILNRKKTGFGIPVDRWINSRSVGRERGLRGWSRFVYSNVNEASVPVQRRRGVLALVPEAFGGRGGIAQYNRDLLSAVASHSAVSSVTVVARIPARHDGNTPSKVRSVSRAAEGKVRFARHAISEGGPDRDVALVICGHVNLLPAAWLAARRARVPMLLMLYGVEAWRPPASLACRAALKTVRKVAGISLLTLERFRLWAPAVARVEYLLPNGVDLAAFQAAARGTESAKGEDGPTLLSLGRMAGSERYKGFDEVLEVLPRLASEFPGVRYVLAGDGDDKARLEAKATALGLSDRVRFTGYVPESEKAALYRSADVYVTPSYGEGFGFVVLEALASGIPVVASSLDGTREAVREGELGVLVNPHDPDSVVEGIRSALGRRRGVPEGLAHFGLREFRGRCHAMLGDIFQGSRRDQKELVL